MVYTSELTQSDFDFKQIALTPQFCIDISNFVPIGV